MVVVVAFPSPLSLLPSSYSLSFPFPAAFVLLGRRRLRCRPFDSAAASGEPPVTPPPFPSPYLVRCLERLQSPTYARLCCFEGVGFGVGDLDASVD